MSKRTSSYFLIISSTLVSSFFFIPWLRDIIAEKSGLSLIFILFIFFLALYNNKKSKSLGFSVFILFLVLMFLQIQSANLQEVYKFSPSELDLQIQRMNYYPPSLARFGYILERKYEVQIIDKLIENFFDAVDINQYFPGYFHFLAFPFFVYGIFTFFRSKNSFLSLLFIMSILAISIISVHGKYGPFIIFPFIFLFIYIGIWKIFEFVKRV